MYGVLGALCARGWLRSGRAHSAILLVLLAIAVGAADELHQRSVAGRSADPRDWVADIAGVAAGFTLVARLGQERPLREKKA